MNNPLRFCFGIHLHQPVGNFDSVFEQHMTEVYRPLLASLLEGEAWPIAIHVSGPLLDWIESHQRDWLDELGRAVADGQVELLTAGHDEPILAMLSQRDRVEQVRRHRERLMQRFGVDVRGLWLTERVWEPDLPADLAAAGVHFGLVDDRHFLATGLNREQLHQPWVTESGGQPVTLLPIDMRLRYLIPFRPVDELATMLRDLRSRGHGLAVLGDDGEKFGGWPGTAEWVYRDGWMTSFTSMLRELRNSGEVVLSRFDEAVAEMAPSGPVYLPTASYREMEGWALPATPARALLALEAELGASRMAGPEGALVRGSHWRNFLTKYPEANRLHKTMADLSIRCSTAGDPPAVRAHVSRAQCNDAYWHGVFGGLYLPFLRGALWREIASAEQMLRTGQPLEAERLDLDFDGRDEVRVTSADIHLVIAPHRGGAIEVYLDLAWQRNLADAMTRHEESYHRPADADDLALHGPGQTEHAADADRAGSPSIHDTESRLHERPPMDHEPRALLVDRFVAAETTMDDFIAGTVPVTRSLAVLPMSAAWQLGERLTVQMDGGGITKEIDVLPGGGIEVRWSWQPDTDTHGWFTTELSLSAMPSMEAADALRWDYPIETMSKSERGFDRMAQGTAVVFRWPASAGRATLRLDPRG